MVFAKIGASDKRVSTLGYPFTGGTYGFNCEVGEGTNSTLGKNIVTVRLLVVARRLVLATLGESCRFDIRVKSATSAKKKRHLCDLSGKRHLVFSSVASMASVVPLCHLCGKRYSVLSLK